MAISYVAVGTSATVATGSATPGLPSVSPGDMMVMTVVWRSTAAAPTITGWTQRGATATVTVGAEGADSGTVSTAAYTREFQTGDTAPSVDSTGRNVILAWIVGYRRGAGSAWEVDALTAVDSTINTSHIAEPAANFPGGARLGDWVVGCAGVNGDAISATRTSLAATWTGTTTAGIINRANTGTTNGNDCRIFIDDFRSTTTAATGAPSITWTWGTGSTTNHPASASVYLRLSEVPTPLPVTLTAENLAVGNTITGDTGFDVTGSNTTGLMQVTGDSALKGAKSFAAVSALNAWGQLQFDPKSEAFFTIDLSFAAWPTTQSRFLRIASENGTTLAGGGVFISTTGQIWLNGLSSTGSVQLALNTHYRIGYRYKAGTGSNGIAELSVAAANAAFPATPQLSATTHTSTLPVAYLYLGETTGTAGCNVDAKFDDITVSAAGLVNPVSGNNATGSGTLELTGAGQATQSRNATGSGTLPLTGAGTATQSRNATGSGTLTPTGSGTGTQSRNATGQGTLDLFGVGLGGAAVQSFTGSGAGQLLHVATGTASTTRNATGSPSLSLSSIGAATTSRNASGAGTLALTGSGTGTVPVAGKTGSGSGLLILNGEGEGTAGSTTTRLREITAELLTVGDSTVGPSGFDSENVIEPNGLSVVSTGAIKGSKSFLLSNAAVNVYGRADFTATGQLYATMYVTFKQFPNSGATRFLRITDNTGTSLVGLRILATGVIDVTNFGTVPGTFQCSLNTMYRIGLRYTKGGGTDAVVEAYAAAGDAVFGAPFASLTTGTAQVDAARVYVGHTTSDLNTEFSAVFDDIIIDTGSIADPTDVPSGTGVFGWNFTEYPSKEHVGSNVIDWYGPFPQVDTNALATKLKVRTLGKTASKSFRIIVAHNNTSAGFDRPATTYDFVSSQMTIAAGSAATTQEQLLANLPVTRGDKWFGIWWGGTGDGVILGDDKMRSKYTQSATYSSSGAPPAITQFTTDPSRDCPSVWVEYTADAVVPVASGNSALITTPLSENILVPNPWSGPFRWRGEDKLTFPLDDGTTGLGQLLDFQRYTHRNVETSFGVYNFSAMTTFRNNAVTAGRSVGFGIRWMTWPDGGSRGEPVHVPDYIANDSATYGGWYRPDGTYVPDWNNANFIARMNALIDAFAAQFGTDTAVSWIHMMGPGKFGEWAYDNIYTDGNSPTGKGPMTTANGNALLDRYNQKFSNKVRTMFLAAKDEHNRLLEFNPDVGGYPAILGDWNAAGTQFWGSSGRSRFDRYRLYRSWRTAPWPGETVGMLNLYDTDSELDRYWKDSYKCLAIFHISTYGNGNWYTTGISEAVKEQARKNYYKVGYRYRLAQLDVPSTITVGAAQTWKAQWFNRGTAILPAFVPYQVRYELRATTTGPALWTGTSTVNLRNVEPTQSTPVAHTETFTVTGLANGAYKLYVRIVDTNNFFRNMHLDQAGLQTSTHTYYMGDVTVQAAGQVTGAGSGTLTMTSAGTGSTSRNASGGPSLQLSAVGVGRQSRNATGAGTLELLGVGTSTLSRQASGAGELVLVSVGTATVPRSGAGEGTLLHDATGQASTSRSGSGEPSLHLTGTGEGTVGLPPEEPEPLWLSQLSAQAQLTTYTAVVRHVRTQSKVSLVQLRAAVTLLDP